MQDELQDEVQEEMQEEMEDDLALGYHFRPTDSEAFAYLYKKLYGGEGIKECENVHPELIGECDVYECEPSKLPSRGEDSYYFTPRTLKNDSMVDRCTRDGKGYWRMSHNWSDDGVPAKKNTLVYHYKAKDEKGKGVKTDWIMHEYELLEMLFPSSSSAAAAASSSSAAASSSSSAVAASSSSAVGTKRSRADRKSSKRLVSKRMVLCSIYENKEEEGEENLEFELEFEKLINSLDNNDEQDQQDGDASKQINNGDNDSNGKQYQQDDDASKLINNGNNDSNDKQDDDATMLINDDDNNDYNDKQDEPDDDVAAYVTLDLISKIQ